MQDAAGNRLHKTVVIKILPLDEKQRERIVLRAAPGRAYTPKGIDEILADTIKAIDQRYPGWDFKLVEISENEFNFVYVGLRPDAMAVLEKRRPANN